MFFKEHADLKRELTCRIIEGDYNAIAGIMPRDDVRNSFGSQCCPYIDKKLILIFFRPALLGHEVRPGLCTLG